VVVLQESSLGVSSVVSRRPAGASPLVGARPHSGGSSSGSLFAGRSGVWLAVCLAVAALLVLWLTPPGHAQILEGGTVKGQHGDWQVVCRPPPPGAKNEICGAVQSVTAEDNQNVGLTAIVQRHSDGKLTMRVVAPLGVFLGKALGVQIDTKHEGHVPFDRCLAVGCQAQMLLEAPLLAKLKTGKTLVFIIYRTQEVGVGIPLSLAGFEQALAGLK
jgi:invasion protein IalB